MNEKTLKVVNFMVNKKEFHKSEQPINLDLVHVDRIVISHKFKCNVYNLKYFVTNKEGDNAKPLCIMLPQMSGYIKIFENGVKNMSFLIKYDNVLDEYNEIWNKVKKTLNIIFHSMPVHKT